MLITILTCMLVTYLYKMVVCSPHLLSLSQQSQLEERAYWDASSMRFLISGIGRLCNRAGESLLAGNSGSLPNFS